MSTAEQPAREPKKPRTRTALEPSQKSPDLDKVREILFGEHVQGLEGALQQTEARILDQIERLRADVEKRCDALETRIDDVGSSGTSEMTGLREEFTTRCEAIAAELGNGLSGLRRSAMDRKQLSTMLDQLAKSMNGDPGPD